jgi:hypothetical protein
MEDLKIYTIDELSDLKKGSMTVYSGSPSGISRQDVTRNPDGSFTTGPKQPIGDSGKGRGKDKQKRKSKGTVSYFSGGKQITGFDYKQMKKQGVKGLNEISFEEAEENRKKMNKSLGDCYSIDELYEELKKGKV